MAKNAIATEYIQLAASADGIGQSISDALNGVGTQAGSSFSSGFGKTALALGGTIMAVGTAAFATGSAVVKATQDVAAYGDNIDKMSQKMGLSAETYQEWEAVMQHSGTSMETMKASMKTLASAAETGKDAFEKLGISQEALASMSQEKLFESTITALQNVDNETERTYLAGQLLGRGATELGALLNTSAEETQAMRDRVRELGGVMSESAVKDAAAFQDTLQDMQTGFQSLGRNLISNFMPSMTMVMDGLTDLSTGDYDIGVEKIGEGIDAFISETMDKVPQFLEVGAKIVITVAESFASNLPKITAVAAEMIVMLINTINSALPELLPIVITAFGDTAGAILQNLPIILSSLIELISTLADFILKDGLPMIIGMLPGLITGVISFVLSFSAEFTNLVFEIIDALLSEFPTILLMICAELPGLVSGLVSAVLTYGPELGGAMLDLTIQSLVIVPAIIAELIAALPTIFQSLIQGFKTYWPDMKQAGMDAFEEAISGMGSSQVMSDLTACVTELILSGVNTILSDVAVFRDAGTDLMNGLIAGIKDKISEVTNVISGIANTVSSSFKKVLGISSPSKVFAEYGEYIDEGLAAGIIGGIGTVKEAVSNLTDATTNPFTQKRSVSGSAGTIGYQTAYVGAGNGEETSGLKHQINLTVPVYIGQKKFATAVMEAIDLENYISGGR